MPAIRLLTAAVLFALFGGQVSAEGLFPWPAKPGDICRAVVPTTAHGGSPETDLGDEISDPIPDDPEFGKYGYRHGDLHKHGSIRQLMDITGSYCCDGGTGGECRVTKIRRGADGQGEFKYGDKWCPLSKTTKYAFVSLPKDATAVVCASPSVVYLTQCPSATYCAGMAADG